MHTVYTVMLVCLTLCTWPVSGSHKVNKVHTACRIAGTLFFLRYFSAYKAEKCAVVDYYTVSSLKVIHPRCVVKIQVREEYPILYSHKTQPATRPGA